MRRLLTLAIGAGLRPGVRAACLSRGGNDQQGRRHACSAADLVPGVVVHEAELRIGPGGAAFKRVKLVR